MIIKFLGTGSNGGIPQLDCRCINCETARKFNGWQRLRSCLAFSENAKDWTIIDCGPDFNRQLSFLNILMQDIKSVTMTHLHPDHSIGLTEFGFGKPHGIQIEVAKTMQKEMRQNSMFNHLFEVGFTKFATTNNFKFVPISHWPNHSCQAIVFGKSTKVLFASDCAIIDDKLLAQMQKVDLIIFDGTFLNESKFNHLAIKDSCPILTKLKKPVIFTHINHSENEKEITKFIKKFGFKLAFDGMEVNI